jgi:uncharacterized damage-inducible protein DinB
MSVPFLEPTTPIANRSEVFLTYLDFFRERLTEKLEKLSEVDLRTSRLASNWTPIELLNHLRHVERRWLEWGFEGIAVADPWADRRDDRWYVGPDTSRADLLLALREQAARTRAIVESHELSEPGQPGPRWDGQEPPSLERILFHLLQEYARHVGHLDIVAELSVGEVGEVGE